MTKSALKFSLICLVCLATPRLGFADPSLPVIIGAPAVTTVQTNESLMELARRTGFGFEAVANANPGLDPWLAAPGEVVVLPSRNILPTGTTVGLTINLAEMRLFHVPSDHGSDQLKVYPIGIGRSGRETPEGRFFVFNKRKDPVWRVPEGLKTFLPELPSSVPPGPDNPLGRFWLGLSAPGYGIHGTNRPLGVGRRISYGCLRLYPEDIEQLYDRVPLGTQVTIVYQPVKAGWDGEELLIEVHPDYLNRFDNLFQEALRVISRIGVAAEVDYRQVQLATKHPDGLLHPVGMRKP